MRSPSHPATTKLYQNGEWKLTLSIPQKRATADKLFQEVGPRFAKRPGGYTRILKLGHRDGDGSAALDPRRRGAVTEGRRETPAHRHPSGP